MKKLTRTKADWALEFVAAASVVATIASLGFYGCFGPGEAFPVHYNVWGEVDDWGMRSALWIGVCLSAGVWVLLTAGEWFCRRYVCMAEMRGESGKNLWRLRERMSLAVKAALLLLVSYIQYGGVWIALGRCERLNAWVLLSFLIVLVVIPVIFCVVIYVRRKG